MSRASGVCVTAMFVVTALAGMIPVPADDWPQWRGIHRDGKSAETGLLQEWPDGGPSLAWKSSGLGGGYSSVAIARGRIYTMGDLGDAQYAIAVKDGTGELLWKTEVGPSHKDKYLGPRATPTFDDDRIYLVTTEGDVFCLKAADGNVVWKRSIPKDFNGVLMKAMGSYDWKFAESPLVDGDRVIVTPGHVEAMMVALDKNTGEEIWRTAGDRIGPLGADGAAYSSAVVSEAAGVRQYVQLVGRGVIGVDAATGKLLWSYNHVANDIANCSTPLVRGNHVFASTAYGAGSGLIEIKGTDGGVVAEEVYFIEGENVQNHHGGLILHDGVVYTGTGHKKGFPIAVDFKSGNIAWGPIRNEGKDSAAVAYADGRLYFRYQDGRVILFEATPEEYRERGTFLIPEVKQFSWPHPAIANGKLYLREQDNLYVYDIRAAGADAPTGAGAESGTDEGKPKG